MTLFFAISVISAFQKWFAISKVDDILSFSAIQIFDAISIFFANVWIFQIFLLFFNVSFLDKCTGNLDESQEQEPPKQPQEASEAAEDLSVYEEMYRRGEWSCFMCSKWFGRKDVLRQHLVLHYKKQLGKQFVSKENNPEKNICGLCQFQAKDPKALIQHIALGTPKIQFSNIFRVLGHFK